MDGSRSKDTSLENILYLLYYKCEPFLKELLKGGNIYLLYSGRYNMDDYFIKKIRKDRNPKDMPWNIHEILDEMFYDKFKIYARSQSMFCTGNYNDANSYGDDVYSIYPIGNNYKYIWSPDIRDLYSDWYDDGSGAYIVDPYDYVVDNYRLSSYHEERIYKIQREYIENDWVDLDDDERDELGEMGYNMDDWIDERIDDGDYFNEASEQVAGEIEEENDAAISNLGRTYTDDNIVKAIKSHNEIMLSGKEVLGINNSYTDGIQYYFKKNGMKKPTSKILHNTFDKLIDDNRYNEITIFNENIK